MRHFILFIASVYLILFLAVLNRGSESRLNASEKTVVRVFGYSAFTGAFGPGPKLRELFEKSCDCRLEYIQGSDSGVLLQRLKIEGESLGADLVIGFDQFDLQKALAAQRWQKVSFSGLDVEPEIKGLTKNDYFVPYDWGALAMMGRKRDLTTPPTRLDDLLNPIWARQMAFEDPRTSSPGFQFLWWVLKEKGEEEGFRYLSQLMKQAHSFSSSWSTAIGLLNRQQVKMVFSYVTSPLYYEIEEKNSDMIALEFKESLPLQVEFLGIPENCRQCELAEKFVNMMLSPEGQKIIMEKNYMLPVLRGVKEGTPFASVSRFSNLMKFEIPSDADVERLLKRWTDLRRGGD